MTSQTRIITTTDTIITIRQIPSGFILFTDPDNVFLNAILEDRLGGEMFAEERHVLVQRMELFAAEYEGLGFVNEETSEITY